MKQGFNFQFLVIAWILQPTPTNLGRVVYTSVATRLMADGWWHSMDYRITESSIMSIYLLCTLHTTYTLAHYLYVPILGELDIACMLRTACRKEMIESPNKVTPIHKRDKWAPWNWRIAGGYIHGFWRHVIIKTYFAHTPRWLLCKKWNIYAFPERGTE